MVEHAIARVALPLNSVQICANLWPTPDRPLCPLSPIGEHVGVLIEAPDHFPESQTPLDASDADLLRAFIESRDDLAFGRIVARHAAGVRRIALLETGNAAAAEDVTQATFIVLSRRPKPALRSARRKSTAELWLHQVARYAAANWRRAEHRRHRREKAAAVPDRAPSDPTQPTDLAEAVAAALRTLRRRDRRLILLRHVEEKPWSEVAAAVSMSPEAARKATDRASDRLRMALQNQGIIAAPTAVAAGLHAISGATATSAAASMPFATTGISVSELAKGTITMMNLKSAASVGMLAAALILGGAGAIVLAQEEPEQRASRPTQAAAELGVVEARLSDGAVVRLKAVGDATGLWRPDGSGPVSHAGLEKHLRVDQALVERMEQFGRHDLAKEYLERQRQKRAFVLDFKTPREYLGHMEVKGTSYYTIAWEKQVHETVVELSPLYPQYEQAVIEVSMPAGEPISRADVQLYSLDTQEAKLDGVRVGLTRLSRTPGLAFGGQDATTTTVIYDGDLTARTIHAMIVTDDGKVLIGNLYTKHNVGNTHMLIFTFGAEQIPHPEDGRLHLALMPLEFVRFSGFATGKGQKATPKVEVLSHEEYVAMLREQAANSVCPVPSEDGVSTAPATKE